MELDVVANSSIESSDPAKHIGKGEVRVLRLEFVDSLEDRGRQLLKHGMVDKIGEIVEDNLKTILENRLMT
jgi:hypothetical protein